MTYFNPKIFAKQNLHDEERKELDYWHKTFSDVIDVAENSFQDRLVDIPIMKDFAETVCKMVCNEVREALGYAMQDNVIAIIDAYEEDVKEVEDPDTYLWEEDE